MDIIADGFFEGLTAVQLDLLMHSGELIELKKDTVFIKEGACESTFYYIQKGSVNVFINSGKNDYVIAALNAGSAVGELVLIDSCPRSASVKTIEDSSIYKFDIHRLENSPELKEILAVIKNKISGELSARLRLTNSTTVSVLARKYVNSIFSVRMLILLSLYVLSLNLIESSEQYVENRTFLSVGLLIIFVLVLFSVVRASGYPLSYYGFRADNLYRNLSEAILFSIPVMLIVVLIKWLIILMNPDLSHIPMIDIASIFENGAPFSLRIYLLSMFFYALFCPVQEFLARGCVQTSLQHLFEGSENQIKWKSIVVSNLIFASAHSHTGADFALFVFLPGLFWGWLFYRQKSLVGVSVSHTLIGVWATFIIGIERVI